MISNLLMAAGRKAVSTVDMVDPFGDNSGVALYKFDGDATDESGTYNGTASNVTYGTGKFGQCVQNLSSSSYVSFGIHHFNVPKTVSFWAKNSFVVRNGQSGLAYDTFLFDKTQLLMYACNTLSGCSSLRLSLNFNIDLTNFTHICVTIHYPSVTIYINGTLFMTGAMNGTVSASSYDFGLWDVSSHNNQPVGGCIDQFRIFNRALTQAEVTALYNESYTPRVYTDFFADNSEILNLKFDGDATDSSGTYDGSATGVTYTTGKFGQCAVFNGTNAYVNLGKKAPELFSEYSGKPRTYSAWVALSSSTDAFFFNYGNLDNQTSPYFFEICFTPTLFHVRTQSYQPGNTFTGKAIDLTHGRNIEYGTFYHIALVFPSDSTGVIKFYINGEFIAQATNTVWSSLSSSYDVWLQKYTGNANSGYASIYVGCKIDSLRVFNRALNATEIISLYEEGGDTYVPYVPPQGFFNDGTEVAYYAFDGDATDSTGTYNGTATGITYTAGKIGQCAVFNKGTSGITTLMDYDVSLPFSFSFFIKTSTKSEQEILMAFANYSSAAVNGFRTRVNQDGTIGCYYGAGTWKDTNSTFPITDNIFHHIVFTYTNGTVCLYIDGVLNKSTTQTPMSSLLCRLTICAFANTASVAYYRFDGSIDQFRIFNRVITQEEVTALYNEGV